MRFPLIQNDPLINAANKGIKNVSLLAAKKTASGVGNLASNTIVGAANTTAGKIALGTGAAMFAGRKLFKKFVDKEDNKKKNITEQNENLPRFPVSVNTTMIPKNPRSVVSFLLKQKSSNYNKNIDAKNLEIKKDIYGRLLKKDDAETGYEKNIGKLTA